MTFNKHNGLSNNLKYYFYLFAGPGHFLRTSNLVFGFIAFWEEESETYSIGCRILYYIPIAGSKAD